MLTQLTALANAVDGRYATDAELQFMSDYLATFDLRLSTYQKIQALEAEIVQEAETRIRATDPQLLMRGIEDFNTKWKADTVRVLRYSAVALLIDDPERLKERLLWWFQTVMRAFRTQRSCDVTYKTIQDVIKKN